MSAKGFLSKLAIGKETTWGTAVSVTQLIPFTSESINKEQSRLDDGILGSDGRRLAEVTQKSVSGGIEADLTYTSFDEILECALGTKAGTGTSTDPFIFSLAEDINNSLTVAINKQVSVHEYIGCKINSLTIQGDGQKLTVSIDILAKTSKRGVDATNTATTIDSAATYGKRILFADCSLSIAGNPIGFSSFNLQLNNNLTAIYENGLEPVEISRNGKREVSFSLELPRYAVDTFNDYFDLDAEVPIVLSATNGTNYFEINIPVAKISNTDPTVSGAEIIKQSVEFTVLRGASPEFSIKRY